MSLVSQVPDNEANDSTLNPVLSFLECCIECPARAAQWVACVVTLAALAIVTVAGLTGAVAGVGLAIVYAGSCWALWLYLSSRERQR